MTDLPLILAGPIVRRVEPRLASVWVALSERREVELQIWEGLANAPVELEPLHKGSAEVRRIGEHLFLALAMIHIEQPRPPLDWGRTYAYDLVFSGGGGDPTRLAGHGLLTASTTPHVNLPIGYVDNALPSFMLPPPSLHEVKLAHGSCRLARSFGRDAFAALDHRLRETRTTPLARPHQLYLTGDQIYADDISPAMVPLINEVGRLVLGVTETLPVNGKDWPADLDHFPAGRRQRLCKREGKLTSKNANSHVLSFGEFAALYLLTLSNVLWKDLEPQRAEHAARRQARAKLISEIPDSATASERAKIVAAGNRMLVPDTRPDAPAEDGVDDDRDDSPDSDPLGELLPPSDPKRLLFDLLTPKKVAGPEHFGHEKPGDPRIVIEEDLDNIRQFLEDLPRARRVLANVATYMVFDDHEVTDDWDIHREWWTSVRESPLGRTVLRNGLATYGLFQGWGNDPVAWSLPGGTPFRRFLDACEGLFPAGATAAPSPSATAQLDTLLDLQPPGEPRTGAPDRVAWHWSMRGPAYTVIALDTRTRRFFQGRHAPPHLLSPDALTDQIPDEVELGSLVTLVISPLPALGAPLVEEWAHPIIVHALSDPRKIDDYHSGAIDFDPENWAWNPDALEALLARLARRKRVVLLSGDIHFTATTTIGYWQANAARELVPTARFVQLIVSAIRQTPREYVQFLPILHSALAQNIFAALSLPSERLGWRSNSPRPIALDWEHVPSHHRPRLQEEPLVVSTRWWPVGTTHLEDHPPDWAWKLDLVKDTRPDAPGGRPAEARPQPALTQDFGEVPTLGDYMATAARQAHEYRFGVPRRVVWETNVAVISFELRDENWWLRQELLWFHPLAPDPGQPEAYTVHETLLEPPPESDSAPTFRAAP